MTAGSVTPHLRLGVFHPIERAGSTIEAVVWQVLALRELARRTHDRPRASL